MGTRALGVETFDPAGTLPAAAGVFCPLEGQCPEGGGLVTPPLAGPHWGSASYFYLWRPVPQWTWGWESDGGFTSDSNSPGRSTPSCDQREPWKVPETEVEREWRVAEARECCDHWVRPLRKRGCSWGHGTASSPSSAIVDPRGGN